MSSVTGSGTKDDNASDEERGSVCEEITLDLIAELDAIEQQKMLLSQERKISIETARDRYLALNLAEDAVQHIFDELYWSLPNVGAGSLASFFGQRYRARNGLTPSPRGSGVFCIGCGDELLSRSREHLAQLLRDRSQACPEYGYCRCDSCHKAWECGVHNKWSERRRRDDERIERLRSLPYSVYLQTAEWQTTRTSALRRARYACQLCKRTDTILDVHHNTYERRGFEIPSDLVVLCRDCHGKHHDKLVAARQ